MANIKDLKKYIGYEFSSGCYTGDDYKSFQTKYINYLRTMCQNNHWQLVNVGRNHYCFSAFIKSAENKCVYVSISDVRYFSNEWYNHINSAYTALLCQRRFYGYAVKIKSFASGLQRTGKILFYPTTTFLLS